MSDAKPNLLTIYFATDEIASGNLTTDYSSLRNFGT